MAGKTIVIADDDKMMRKLLESLLTKEGYQVCSACDGEEGLMQISKVKPDAVILDVVMPKMGGLEVLAKLKLGELSGIPVIMLTSMEFEEDVARGMSLGAAYYLIKPVQRAVLFECLRAVLK